MSESSKVRKRLGKYRLKRKLGAGGMGAVFLADDNQLERTVALKILPRELTANPALVKRFGTEVVVSAQMRHENIVDVYESGEIDGHLYIAFEYVDGMDVTKLVRKQGPLAPRHSLEVVRHITLALQHAWRRQIVHRDIKPSNILVTTNGVAKLADLGLARTLDETADAGITREGTTVGTVDYMAPEQARGSRLATVRSDIYSLGCTWYFMLTGRPPFTGDSLTNKLMAHVNEPRPDPRKLNPAVSKQLVRMLHKMMAPDVKKRYQTPAELLRDLDKLSFKRGTEREHQPDHAPVDRRPPQPERSNPAEKHDSAPAGGQPAARLLRRGRRPLAEGPAFNIQRRTLAIWIGGAALAAAILGTIIALTQGSDNQPRRSPFGTVSSCTVDLTSS